MTRPSYLTLVAPAATPGLCCIYQQGEYLSVRTTCCLSSPLMSFRDWYCGECNKALRCNDANKKMDTTSFVLDLSLSQPQVVHLMNWVEYWTGWAADDMEISYSV